MREFRTYGSMRGALGNGRPYRDQRCPVPHGESLAEAGRGAVGVASFAASSRPWPAINMPFSRTSTGMVQPNSRSDALICSICSGP